MNHLRNRPWHLWLIAVFDICIMLMTFAFYLYCRRAWRAPEKKG